jgi:hypothetical protein
MRDSILVDGTKNEQAAALPNSPFSGEMGNVHVVYATPTNVREVLFDQCGVVSLVELLICKQRYTGTLSRGRAGKWERS